MQPAGGPDPSAAFSKGFFEVAAAQNPKPKTLAIVAADAEFPHNAADGARKNAKEAGLQIVYDKTYPPTTTDYTPIVRAVDAANADVVFSASYPPDAVGIVRAANEVGLKAKIFGGGLVGLQYASIKQQLGPLLNGIINYDFWEPASTLSSAQDFPGVLEFLKKYQARAAAEGVDPLGYYLPPFAYANLQVLQAAVEGTKSLDQDKLAEWLRQNTIKTVVGNIAFGPNGEWKEARVLQVQFHDVQGSDLEQWKTADKQTILWPDKYATGKPIYPYGTAKK
jgi:branched-chain amino acid transport system substrate-binding protein